ncbi:MAG: hypothetical protein HYU34_05465 [Candidatus Omnitrophica bacterium]|nr:hypothetical protein [Candidatus Omnitrophota bacterium]
MANLARIGKRFNLNWGKKEDHPVKFSALLALREALIQEKYEECAEIIAIAKEFGARDREIYYLLEDPRRRP